MRPLFSFLALLCALTASSQQDVLLRDENVLLDTLYYKYVPADSAFYAVREVRYRNGLAFASPTFVGDTAALVRAVLYDNFQAAEYTARALIAAAQSERSRRRIEQNERLMQSIAGADLQALANDVIGISGSYSAARKAGGNTRIDPATIEVKSGRARLVIAGEGAYSITIYGSGWIRLERGNGSSKTSEDLILYQPGLYRNVSGTFILRQKKGKGQPASAQRGLK